MTGYRNGCAVAAMSGSQMPSVFADSISSGARCRKERGRCSIPTIAQAVLDRDFFLAAGLAFATAAAVSGIREEWCSTISQRSPNHW